MADGYVTRDAATAMVVELNALLEARSSEAIRFAKSADEGLEGVTAQLATGGYVVPATMETEISLLRHCPRLAELLLSAKARPTLRDRVRRAWYRLIFWR